MNDHLKIYFITDGQRQTDRQHNIGLGLVRLWEEEKKEKKKRKKKKKIE